MVEKTYLKTSKQETRHHTSFSMLEFLQKRSNIIIGLFQQTTEVQCIYLALKTLEISSKKV